MGKVHQPGLAMPAQLAIDSEGKVYGVIGPDGKVYGLGLGGNLVNYETNPVTERTKVLAGDVPVAVPDRTSPVRVATFGDSTANVGAGNTDYGVLTAPFPASGATSLSGEWAKFGLHQYYPPARIVANGGISGETTAQMLARDTAAYSAARKAITDILNLSPDVVLLRAGSINDLAGTVTPANIDSVVAATFAAHVEIIERLLSGGVYVIDEGIFGYSGVAANPDTVRVALMRLNAMYKTYAETSGRAICYLDLTGIVRDSAGNYLPNVSNDGTHLNMLGGELLSELEGKTLQGLFGYPSAITYPGNNLIANPMLAITTDQAWGKVATGYSLVPTNASRANAKIETINGIRMQTTEFTPNAVGASVTAYLPFDPTVMGIVANDIFGMEMYWMIEALDGGIAPTPSSIYVRGDIYKNAAGRVVFEDRSSIMAPFAKTREMRHSAMRIQIQEPSANLTTGSVFSLLFTTNDMRPFKLGVGGARFVKQ